MTKWQAYLIVAGYLANGLVSSLIIRHWGRRVGLDFREWNNPWNNPPTTPMAVWLPVLIVMQAWMLISGGLLCILLVIVNPVLRGAGAMYGLGFVCGFVLCVVGFAGYDAVLVVRVRQLERRQQH
jgi:hypothetical protein